jgi:hypothetical protein
MMNKRIILLMAVLVVLVGCQTYSPTVTTDAASIPDQTYDVTEYRGTKPLSYAVLFDIPDDGMPVAMYHTALTKRIGLDSPGQYVNYFQTRIKAYKTLKISDREGTVRAYLMMYSFLYYEINERPVGEKILVRIGRPAGPVLQPGNR